ncbi:hypothetical protein [Pyrobaculum ferrireducens]|uniref:Uncharacterized protein n=1 Tax=Pyrobaculum ferrireducens TaxID=1104324 RepID=G7VH67_9CREN|nr:hypothetical protein [Pyrobaculum ferrireducens]AET31970.1 hypothetical protein P186_0518 [Pyrobaculum ferrireducens]
MWWRVFLAAAVLAALIAAAEVKWAVFSNPSGGPDLPWGLCLAGGYVYVVGYEYGALGGGRWRVERRDATDGRLVGVWTWDPTPLDDWPTSCVAAGGRIYVVGHAGGRWALAVLDADLKPLAQLMEEVEGAAYSAAADWLYLYVAGYEKVNERDWQWRVEKRRLGDLSLAAVYTSNPTSYGDMAKGIGVDPATGRLWVVGSALDIWWVEILDRELRRVKARALGGWFGPAVGVAFDGVGNAYVYGVGGVVKFGAEGEPISEARIRDPTGAVYAGGRLYVVALDGGYRLAVYGPSYGSLLAKINETDLTPQLLRRVYVGEAPYRVIHQRAAYERGVVYAAVEAGVFSDVGWLILSISLTAPVTVAVVDGSGAPRDWLVEVLDPAGAVVATGRGRVEAQLLPGENYTARVHGPWLYNATFTAAEGYVAIQVPTAVVEVAVVDGRPAGPRVVVLRGPVEISLDAPGRSEVPAGRYTVEVYAGGRAVKEAVELKPGETHVIVITAPEERRTFAYLLAAALLTAISVLYVGMRRATRRGG